jgi:RNA polymerase sigma-70 factor (ECF subfamily)
VPLTAADRLLLQQCLNREQGAWREFVDRFIGLIYHVIQHSAHLRNQTLRAEDTEDLAAEILSQIVARDYAVLRQFRGASSLASYLTVVARRICVHQLVKRAAIREVQPANDKPVVNHHADGAPPPGAQLENLEEVERLLERLPPRDRQVARMFYIEGRTYNEISTELGIPRNSIGPILARVRGQLEQDSPS